MLLVRLDIFFSSFYIIPLLGFGDVIHRGEFDENCGRIHDRRAAPGELGGADVQETC